MIVRILTDHFTPAHKIVASIDEKKPFSNLIGLILRKCAVSTMEGHCLYLCKGNPPRPSVPFLPPDLKKSPKKLGVKQGDYLMIKKETGGIKERRKALVVHEQEETLKKEDPKKFRELEAEKAEEQKRENKRKEVALTLGSDDELPKEMILEMHSPAWVAAAVLIAAAEVGMWLEPRHLAKFLSIFCAAIAAAVPTYYCEREHNKRVAQLKSEPPSTRKAPPGAAAPPQSIRWAVDSEERMMGVFAALKQAYLSRPGDIVDEVISSMRPAPDLRDPELVVAMSAFAQHEVFGEKLGLPSELDSFILSTVGAHGSDMDRVLLCGPPADPQKLDKYKPVNVSFTAAVSQALFTACQEPTDANAEERASAMKFAEANAKWIFHAWSLSSSSPATLYKGLSHQAMQAVASFRDFKRGSQIAWPGFCECATALAPAETVLTEGFKSATANPFGKGGGGGAERPASPRGKGKNAKGSGPAKPKAQPADDKGTLLFKVTKVPEAIAAGPGTAAYTPAHPVVLTPFNFYEVQSVRPNTNVSENSYDVDIRFQKAWQDEDFLKLVKENAVAASTRLLLKLRETETLMLVVLALTTGVACIAPILEEREERNRLMLMDTAGRAVVVAAGAAAAAAAEAAHEAEKAKRQLEREEAEAAALLRAAKDADERKRLEAEIEARKKKAEEMAAERAKAAERDAAEAAAAAAASALEPMDGEDAQPVKQRQPTPQLAPAVVEAPPARRRRKMDLSVEELDAIKEHEARRAERRRELDQYEKERRQDALDEVSKVMRSKQEEIEKSLKEAEGRQLELMRRNAEFEQRLVSGEKEMERRREQLRIEASELEERRKRLEQEQEFAVTHLTRVTDEQLKAMKEVASENEALRQRYLGQADEVIALRSEIQRLPAIEEVVTQNKRIEHRLDEMSRGGGASFQSNPLFAPVLAWLVGLGLGRFADVFAKNEFDIHAACELSEADLDQLGITALGPRRRLLWEAKALKATMSKAPHDPELSKLVASPDNGIRGLNLRKVLSDFYEKYDPVKVAQVDAIFDQFQGQYDALFATLSSIYPLYFPSPYRDRTVVLLKKVCPTLLPAVDVLLDLHQDREVELLGELLRASEGLPMVLQPGRAAAGEPESVRLLPPSAALAALPSYPSYPTPAVPESPLVRSSLAPPPAAPVYTPSAQHGTPVPASGPRGSVLRALQEQGAAPHGTDAFRSLAGVSEELLLRAFTEVDQGLKPRV